MASGRRRSSAVDPLVATPAPVSTSSASSLVSDSRSRVSRPDQDSQLPQPKTRRKHQPLLGKRRADQAASYHSRAIPDKRQKTNSPSSYNLRPRDKGKHKDNTTSTIPSSSTTLLPSATMSSRSTRTPKASSTAPAAAASESADTNNFNTDNSHSIASTSAHDTSPLSSSHMQLDFDDNLDIAHLGIDQDSNDEDRIMDQDRDDNDVDDDDVDDDLHQEDDMDDLHDGDIGEFSSFAASIRDISGMISGMNTRLKSLISQARASDKLLARYTALQEVSEILSISTEETIGSNFDPTPICKDLVAILTDPGFDAEWEEGPGQIMLVASRCLLNLMEALPGSSGAVVYAGAVPVLCSKLVEIQYMDLAEQNLITLKKLSTEVPSAIVREGGLAALLQFFDFFYIHSQRTAVSAAANCCRNLSSDSFQMVLDIMPTLRNVLASLDDRVLEQGCLAVTRIVESYRHRPEKLSALLSSETLSPLASLLVPGGGGSTISAATYAQILRVFSIGAKACPEVAISLIEMNIAETLYHVLNGLAAPDEQDLDKLAQLRLEDDLTVLQNLVQRPKDQVQETLILVSELLPSLPKTGLFDSKAFFLNEFRAPTKTRMSSRTAATAASTTEVGDEQQQQSQERPVSPSNTAALGGEEESVPSPAKPDASEIKNEEQPQMTPAEKHVLYFTESTESRQAAVNRFNALMLPTLIDVYSASVSVHIRSRAVSALLKIVNFARADVLAKITKRIPIAAFLAAILASRDQPSLVTCALQLVELLIEKIPSYPYIFHKEGVLREVQRLAKEPLLINSLSKKSLGDASAGISSTDLQRREIEITTRINDPESVISQSESSSTSGVTLALRNKNADISIVNDSLTYRTDHSNSNSSNNDNSNKITITISEALVRDSITRRAKRAFEELCRHESDSPHDARDDMLVIQSLAEELRKATTEPASSLEQEKRVRAALVNIIAQLERPNSSISSFEMLESGLVGALLDFASDSTSSLPQPVRRRILVDCLIVGKGNGKEYGGPSLAMSLLVKKLQESLSRLEEFQVVTALGGSSDDRRYPASMLTRQLKLRLVSDVPDIPKSCNNIIVSIHAIATFQAFHDYLRPRISASTSLSRLRNAASSSSPSIGVSGAATPDQNRNDNNSPPSADDENVGDESSSNKLRRRRSSRLAKVNDENSTSASAQRDQVVESSLPSGANTPESVFGGRNGRPTLPPLGDAAASGPGATERPVNVQVSDDGSAVKASTPQGTRIATPTPETQAGKSSQQPQTPAAVGSTATPSALASASPSRLSTPFQPSPRRQSSYASAVRTEPKDWHIVFSLGGQDVPLDTTIYGAVHNFETRSSSSSPSAVFPMTSTSAAAESSSARRDIWSNVYTVKFRRVNGPAPSSDRQEGLDRYHQQQSISSSSSNLSVPDSISKNSAATILLKLLRVLYNLNVDWPEIYGDLETLDLLQNRTLPMSTFINNKLTAKLNRQLDEPMIVASSCLPLWSLELPQYFRFLFPLETRFSFLQSTSFGYARLLHKWIDQARNNRSSRQDQSLSFLGRLDRQKVRISRDRLLESTMKVFQLYGSSRAMLEFEYFDEVGTGLGPTLEFFAMVSKEFMRRNLHLWREGDSDALQYTDGDDDEASSFVFNPLGLYPSPIDPNLLHDESIQKRLSMFKLIGQFVARSLFDGRIIDMPLGKPFMRLLLNEDDVPLTIDAVRFVDKGLATSLDFLSKFSKRKTEIEGDDENYPTSQSKADAIEEVTIDDSTILELALDFTVPGYDIELKPDGRSIAVTMDSVDEYIDLLIEFTMVKGVRAQVDSFREGFSVVFPVRDLGTFSPDELVTLVGNVKEDWSYDTLASCIKTDHGFNLDSRIVQDFLTTLSKFAVEEQREVLQFLTGSPRLPIGGFRGLRPPLTVVKKIVDPPHNVDDYLPSVMTCVNYLKLPDYSSIDVLRERLNKAVHEGKGSFHLS